jgi:hypothetical protein
LVIDRSANPLTDKLMAKSDQLVFCPLGGLGEIGMNAALYGFGPEKTRKWILVDCGMTFAGPEAPGIDIVLPDLAFIEERRKDLLAIIITHAHEDHIGALATFWPKLRAPVYCTQFAAGLISTRKLQEPGSPKVPLHVVVPGVPLELGPFSVEFIKVAHSIPQSCGLAIRTPAGLVVHTGDWKIDDTRHVGWPTDSKRLTELGDEGVLAMICDSTNVMREGISPGEADVAKTLEELIRPAPGRVAVGPLGLEGDEQADLSVHGGLSKALYAYPAAHYPFWQTVRAQARVALWDEALPPGAMGENLTIEGLDEARLWIGDRLVLPDCVLAVSEPRLPCAKFGAALGFLQAVNFESVI